MGSSRGHQRICLFQGFVQEHSAQLLSELPTRWEKLGDLALLPRTCMASPDWDSLGQPLWRTVASALGVERLAMQAPVANTGHCSSIRSAPKLGALHIICPLQAWLV